jgi:thymidylate kinase
MENAKTIIIDGIDLSGKSTLISRLAEKHKQFEFKDRGILTKLTLSHWDNWEKPENLVRNWNHYIILEVDIEEAKQRLANRKIENNQISDKWELDSNLFLFRYRFRNLAAYYGNIHLVDTTNLSKENLDNIIEEIILGNSKNI